MHAFDAALIVMWFCVCVFIWVTWICDLVWFWGFGVVGCLGFLIWEGGGYLFGWLCVCMFF